jgi:hypothetical protein
MKQQRAAAAFAVAAQRLIGWKLSQNCTRIRKILRQITSLITVATENCRSNKGAFAKLIL